MDKALKKFLEDRGFKPNDSLSGEIEKWKTWYRGNVKGFHNYTVWNGKKSVNSVRASLQLGKSICENIANLLFNEKCLIAIESEETDTFVKQIFDENNVYVKLNESQERKAAFGTMAYIPYWTNNGIKINYIMADNIIPLSWENSVINELAVFSATTEDGVAYIFLQLFYTEDFTAENGEKQSSYVIENLLLKKDNDKSSSKYTVVDFSQVPGYETIENKIITGSPTKPFIIDRLNIGNNIDPDNPLGIAIFANAIDSMRFCDTIYDSYLNEFTLGKKRVMVTAEATTFEDGKPVFDPNDLTFYTLPDGAGGLDDKPFLKELDFKLRSAEHQAALQQGLDIFSSQVGFGENYYKYANAGSPATATQVISENNTLFRTLKKHEIILESVLVDLVRLIIEIGMRYNMSLGLDRETEITVTFDDSIIEDKNAELNRRLSEVSAGLLRPELYLMYRYGVSKGEALKMMPEMEQLTHTEGEIP